MLEIRLIYSFQVYFSHNMNTEEIKNRIIEIIRSNRISTTQIADVLGKTGQIPNVHILNQGQFVVGEVVVVYAINNSNYEVHKQLSELDLTDKVLYVHNVSCDRAIFGDLVSKYIMLYKKAKAIVVDGLLRDAHTLVKEKYPIWLSGVSPIGCVNYVTGEGLSKKEEDLIREKYDGTIMVCDDSGVVMIPKEKMDEGLIDKLFFIEYQEDIWYYCLDTLKMSTFDIVCNKYYLKDDLIDKRMLQRLTKFNEK